MAFDPTKPANNSAIVSAELRTQFSGPNDLIQDRVIYADLYNGINANSAEPVAGMALLSMSVSNPPTQAQMQAIANQMDELITALKRL